MLPASLPPSLKPAAPGRSVVQIVVPGAATRSPAPGVDSAVTKPSRPTAATAIASGIPDMFELLVWRPCSRALPAATTLTVPSPPRPVSALDSQPPKKVDQLGSTRLAT